MLEGGRGEAAMSSKVPHEQVIIFRASFLELCLIKKLIDDSLFYAFEGF